MSDYENFIGRVKELSLIGSLSGIMGWDQETMMPPKGGKLRSEMMAFLSSQAHSRITDPKMGKLISSLALIAAKVSFLSPRRETDSPVNLLVTVL